MDLELAGASAALLSDLSRNSSKRPTWQYLPRVTIAVDDDTTLGQIRELVLSSELTETLGLGAAPKFLVTVGAYRTEHHDAEPMTLRWTQESLWIDDLGQLGSTKEWQKLTIQQLEKLSAEGFKPFDGRLVAREAEFIGGGPEWADVQVLGVLKDVWDLTWASLMAAGGLKGGYEAIAGALRLVRKGGKARQDTATPNQPATQWTAMDVQLWTKVRKRWHVDNYARAMNLFVAAEADAGEFDAASVRDAAAHLLVFFGYTSADGLQYEYDESLSHAGEAAFTAIYGKVGSRDSSYDAVRAFILEKFGSTAGPSPAPPPQ